MRETEVKIRTLPDPVLREKSKSVTKITDAHRGLLSKMARIMYDASGIGLAAPQIGINECLCVADIGNGLYKLINPRILKSEGVQEIEEGCLSVPGVSVKVKRAKKVLIEAQDEFGNFITIDAEGLLARVFQHEIDHIQGRLIVDYVRSK